MNPTNNQNERYKYCGAFAWINDIEVHAAAYLSAAIFMIAGIFLVGQPLFKVEVPYLGTDLVTVHQIPGLEWVNGVVLALNMVGLFMLIFPMLKFFEWKYRWFVPVLAVFVTEASAVIVLLLKMDEIVSDALLKMAMELLSVEITVTAYSWLFLAVSILGAGAALRMVLDIKKNKSIYIYE